MILSSLSPPSSWKTPTTFHDLPPPVFTPEETAGRITLSQPLVNYKGATIPSGTMKLSSCKKNKG